MSLAREDDEIAQRSCKVLFVNIMIFPVSEITYVSSVGWRDSIETANTQSVNRAAQRRVEIVTATCRIVPTSGDLLSLVLDVCRYLVRLMLKDQRPEKWIHINAPQ
jgi:hypothetical protein